MEHTFDDMAYYYIHMVQLMMATAALLGGLIYMTREVNEIAIYAAQFAQEKSIVRRTVILFTISYLLRIILTILQIINVIDLQVLGEFWDVQLEILLTIFCDFPPLYYLVY